MNRRAKMHAALGMAWLLMTIPTVLWWSESILWVSSMSIYAIVVGHWSAVEAATSSEAPEEVETEAARES